MNTNTILIHFVAIVFLFVYSRTGICQESENVTLHGHIIDNDNELPVAFASVHVKNQQIGTISDSLGKFTLDIPAGFLPDTIIVSSVGYKKYSEQVKKLSEIKELTIALNDSLFLLDEVIALCYDNVEALNWATKDNKKNKLLLSFATRNITNAANFVKLIKEFHGSPKERNNALFWKKQNIKNLEVKKISFSLVSYKCEYCPFADEVVVALSVNDKKGNNLIADERYKKILENYFQELLDKSFAQGIDFNQLEERNGFMFVKREEVTYSGSCFSYYEEGQKGKVGAYKDGKETGLWVWWHKNGQRGKELGFEDGLKTGKGTWWYSSGKLKHQCDYLNDMKNGKDIIYYESGQLKYEGIYLNDNLHGTCKWYYENGQMEKESIFENGIFMSKQEWDKNGNLIESTVLH